RYFNKISVGVDLKDGEFKAKLASMVAFGNASKVNVDLDVDTAGFSSRVQAAVAAAEANDIKVGMDLKAGAAASLAAKANAIAAGIRPTIRVDVDVDRNGFDMWASRAESSINRVNSSMGRFGGSWMRMGGLATSSFQAIGAAAAVLGPIIAVLIADVMLLGAALAAIVLP